MKKFFTLTLALMATITMWATPTQSYVLTGYSTQIANGKCVNIGGAYCGRKGSNYTPNATYGLPSGNGNVAAVFTVNQTSTITFIMDNQQTSAKSGSVLLASVSDSYYSDCQSGTLGNLPSTASQTKAVSFAKNADSGENEFTFESSVSAGKYIIYWTSSINSSIYLKRIEINSDAKYSVTINPNGGTYASTPEGWTFNEGVYTKSVGAGSFNVPEGLAYSGYDLNGWKDGQGNDITLPITLSHDTTLVAQWATPSATPTITSQPSTSAVEYLQNETAEPLSVEATGAGTLSYQWYSNTEAATTGENMVEIDGATNASYTPSTATLGTLYYFCAVTNTEEGKAPTTVNSDLSGAISVIVDPLGEHTITYALDVTESEDKNKTSIASEEESSSTYLNTLIGITKVGLGDYTKGSKANLTVKIPTPAELDASKYMSVGFTVSTGYKFTPSTITVKAQPVTTEKDVKLVLVDNNSDSIGVVVPAATVGAGSIYTATLSNANNVAFEGNVTLKIYCYGATDTYRLGSPITIAGTVAVKTPPTAIDNTEDEVKAVKVLRDGQIFIENNGHVYNVFGACIK